MTSLCFGEVISIESEPGKNRSEIESNGPLSLRRLLSHFNSWWHPWEFFDMNAQVTRFEMGQQTTKLKRSIVLKLRLIPMKHSSGEYSIAWRTLRPGEKKTLKKAVKATETSAGQAFISMLTSCTVTAPALPLTTFTRFKVPCSARSTSKTDLLFKR